MNGDKEYWLDRPGSADKVYWTLCTVCALLLVVDAFYEKHPHFAVEHLFGFFALFGAGAGVGLILIAREMRRILMRKEDYYDDD